MLTLESSLRLGLGETIRRGFKDWLSYSALLFPNNTKIRPFKLQLNNTLLFIDEITFVNI